MARENYVVGIDASTQSIKAIAWTRDGCVAAEGRAPLSIDQPQPGHAEQDAETWWEGTCDSLQEIVAAIDPDDIGALAISDQRETMVLVDRDGNPIEPASLWIDGRAAETFRMLANEFGAVRLHELSGKPPDVIPAVYRLDWFRRRRPSVLDACSQILDVHAFLTLRLSGTAHATYTSADPFGIFDIRDLQWSRPILDHLGIDETKLPPVHAPGAFMCRVSESAARVTGLRRGTPVYAAGGDGQCAGLGVNAVRPGAVYLNLGTAIVAGLWSPEPLLGQHWRTMTSPTGCGYFLEAVQRAGAFFVNWLVDNFAGGRTDPNVFKRLEDAARTIPIGSDGLLVCPYLTGCMDPHWDPHARASFVGLGAHHGTAHLYRASLEALTLESTRAIDAMAAAGLTTTSVVVVGGGAESDLWTKMVADSTGLPTHRCSSNEASALGAGMIAAYGAGWYATIDDAAQAMTGRMEAILPDRTAAGSWAALSKRQSAVYDATRHFQRSVV